MNALSFFFASLVFIGWGVSVFFDKLATTKLGLRGLWLWVAGFLPALLLYPAVYLFSQKLGFDRGGLIFLFLSSLFNIFALIFYYLVLLKSELSAAAPFTALYPALTVVLAFIFLHEGLTAAKVAGIFLSLPPSTS